MFRKRKLVNKRNKRNKGRLRQELNAGDAIGGQTLPDFGPDWSKIALPDLEFDYPFVEKIARFAQKYDIPFPPGEDGKSLSPFESLSSENKVELTKMVLPLTNALTQAQLALSGGDLGKKAGVDREWTYFGPSVGGVDTGPLPIVIIKTIIGFIKLNTEIGAKVNEDPGIASNPIRQLAYSEYQLQTIDYAVGFIGELQRVKIPFARYPAPYTAALNAIFDVLSYSDLDADVPGFAAGIKPSKGSPIPPAPMVNKHGHIGGEPINYSWSVPRQGGPWYHFTRCSKPHHRRIDGG